ncbi:Uncharacterised protein [Bordetella pertussis]|nr:Uncharacterised protein [Bordetella pertussis]CFO39067.1 Uncharacterised protein [Bordetella pertussis]CFP08609.1 Uncharacterised protein [Bordetella pertussis]CFP12757.1 Uncharacterised protein [Bordetella pertussis]CFW10560.1 Uncharacterised protein [Bordetella pertussis]
MTRSSELQNIRMPTRPSAISPARPDNSTSATSTQASSATDGVLAAVTAADSSENLATKPDSGGSPVTSKAQDTKARPRKAIAAGIATPTTSSDRLGVDGSSRSNRSMVTASTLAPKLRVRSISSTSMNSAPVASTELIR